MGSLLPHNATELEHAVEAEIRTTLATNIKLDTVWRSEECPLDLLPYLAWTLSVDQWDATWPESIKRQVVTSAVAVHRAKGTIGAIRRALDALELGVRISEWFEYGGDPYHFRVDVELLSRGLTDAEITSVLDAIAATKNARSHLERLRMYLTSGGNTYLGSAVQIGIGITVQPWVPVLPEQQAALHTGGFVQISQQLVMGAANG